MSNKVTYKNYNMNQLQMPMDITDWIEENHISKLINQVVEGIDEKILRQSYKGGGRSRLWQFHTQESPDERRSYSVSSGWNCHNFPIYIFLY